MSFELGVYTFGNTPRTADGGYGHTAQAIWMARVSDLHNHRVDHGQVEADWHTIVQEAGVHHLALVVVVVLLVEGPPDALDRTSLHLTLHVTGVNGFASVLDCGVAQYVYLPRLRVYFHIRYVNSEGVASTAWV